jgi:hypothetical protein
MKVLVAAFGITLVISVSVYAVIKFALGIEGHLPEEAAAFSFIASTHIYEALEKTVARRDLQSGEKSGIYNFAAYTIPWLALLLYATIFVVGVTQLVGFYIGLVTNIAGLDFGLSTAGFLQLPVICYGTFVIGRWVGSRCRTHGVSIVILAILVAIVGDHLVMTRLYPDEVNKSFENAPEEVKNFLETFGISNKAAWAYVLTSALGVLVYSTAGCFGFWRGFKHRTERYAAYLFRILPESSRQILVGLAYDEVQSLRPKQGRR